MTRAPGTLPRHERAQMWRRPGIALSAGDVQALNVDAVRVEDGWRPLEAVDIGSDTAVARAQAARLDALQGAVLAGRLVEETPGSMRAAAAVVASATRVDHQRVAHAETPLRCVPLADGLFREPVDKDFDRNACASLHPGERVRVLARGPAGNWLYVHAGYTVGWVQAAGLTPRLSAKDIRLWTQGPHLVPLRDDVTLESGMRMRLGVALPLVPEQAGDDDAAYTVRVPTATGLQTSTVPKQESLRIGPAPLTWENVLDVAFSELGAPYGWGGRAGHRDCSRFLRDVFASFGVQLARHSGVQAQQGTRRIDVSQLDAAAKRTAIAEAAAGGVVLLYMRGHIMLYVGRDGERDFALSAISEFLEPCPGGPPTVRRLDKVAVTTLQLGEGTPRTSFLARIDTLVVFEPEA